MSKIDKMFIGGENQQLQAIDVNGWLGIGGTRSNETDCKVGQLQQVDGWMLVRNGNQQLVWSHLATYIFGQIDIATASTVMSDKQVGSWRAHRNGSVASRN